VLGTNEISPDGVEYERKNLNGFVGMLKARNSVLDPPYRPTCVYGIDFSGAVTVIVVAESLQGWCIVKFSSLALNLTSELSASVIPILLVDHHIFLTGDLGLTNRNPQTTANDNNAIPTH